MWELDLGGDWEGESGKTFGDRVFIACGRQMLGRGAVQAKTAGLLESLCVTVLLHVEITPRLPRGSMGGPTPHGIQGVVRGARKAQKSIFSSLETYSIESGVVDLVGQHQLGVKFMIF